MISGDRRKMMMKPQKRSTQGVFWGYVCGRFHADPWQPGGGPLLLEVSGSRSGTTLFLLEQPSRYLNVALHATAGLFSSRRNRRPLHRYRRPPSRRRAPRRPRRNGGIAGHLVIGRHLDVSMQNKNLLPSEESRDMEWKSSSLLTRCRCRLEELKVDRTRRQLRSADT